MKKINIMLEDSSSYMDAYKAALEMAKDSLGDAILVAWYDRAKNVQGPMETCSEEDWKCALDYAAHHEANLRISVNTDEYVFFFSHVVGDFSELNEHELLEVHADISRDNFSNIQGG